MKHELVHLIREPEGEAAGALVLNHGRGSDENDLYELLDLLDAERQLLGLTTGAPMTSVPPGGRHWYLVPRVGYPDHDTFHASYELLGGFLDELLAERGIAWEHTVIGGFSMGAVMSYAVGLGAGRPAPGGILAFSGFVPTVEGWEPDLSTRQETAVFIHHGARDPVIPVTFAQQAAELLEDGGVPVAYVETEAAHWLPPEAVEPAKAVVAGVARRARVGE